MKINKMLLILMAITLASLLTSCATTTITASWKDDSYQGYPRKALVIGVTGKDTLKRIFENEFVLQLKANGVNAVPSYTVLPLEKKYEKKVIVAKVKELDADSLFITRLVDKKSYETYYPGSVYVSTPGYRSPGWHDYYSRGYSYYSPGYVYQQEIVYIETQLYDSATGKLIWSVVTKTYVDSTMESQIKSFVKVIMKSLSTKGLIPKQ